MTIIVAGGAGADGKTTVLELLTKFWALEGKSPLAIDANPDQNLLSFMGVEGEAPNLCEQFDFLKDALEKGNPDYPNLNHIVDTSPVTQHSRRWSLTDPNDPVMNKFALEHQGARLMQTGTYQITDLGSGCLHDKIGPMIFALQRLYDGMDGEEGMVLVDNAHGRDAFGTPLYAQGDVILVVARPNAKSADILRDYVSMAQGVSDQIGFPVQLAVIGNAMSNDPAEFAEEEAFLKNIAGESYIGSLREDPALKRKFSNAGPALDQISEENYRALSALTAHLERAERIPERRKAWMDLCHGKATWHDALIGPGISEQKTDFVADSPKAHQCGSGCNHHHHRPKREP